MSIANSKGEKQPLCQLRTAKALIRLCIRESIVESTDLSSCLVHANEIITLSSTERAQRVVKVKQGKKKNIICLSEFPY